jgi:branched-chain amino acid transport system permease protein
MSSVLTAGLFMGILYGMLTTSIVVVYRGSRVLNFAFAPIGMIGAFAFSEAWTTKRLPLGVALGVGVGVSALLGLVVERFVIRPLRGRAELAPMLSTAAVGSVLLVFATRRWGSTPRPAPPLIEGPGVHIGSVFVQRQQLLLAGVTLLALALLTLLNNATTFGLRMRAVAIDPYAAGLSGVNVSTTSAVIWLLGGALAGLAGILVAPLVAFSVVFMSGLALRAIAAALIGGLGNVALAFAAAVGLGLSEAFIGYKSPVTGVVEATLAVLVIAIVLIRPAGLGRTSAI